jgi:FkbH-like protein
MCERYRVQDEAKLIRIKELLDRTTQYNTTGRKFHLNELASLMAGPNNSIYAMRVSDHFGNYGLVGACVVEDDTIVAIAISCRVLQLDVDHGFVNFVIEQASRKRKDLKALFIPTSRNSRARNVFRDHKFEELSSGSWRLQFPDESVGDGSSSEVQDAAICGASSFCLERAREQ